MARNLSPGESITEEEFKSFQRETGGDYRSVVVRTPTKAENESGADYEALPIRRYYLSDGESYVEMQRNEKGDFTVIDYHPSTALKATTTTATSPTTANDAEKQRQRERNQAAGAGYYTDDEISRGIVSGQTATEAKTEASRKETEAKTETERKETEAKRAKWTEMKKEVDQTTGKTVITEQNELGETRTREATVIEEKKPTMIEGKPYLLQPDGTYKPVEIQGAIKPGGGPPLTDLKLQYGQIVDGLTAYGSKLQEAVQQGIMTPDEFKTRWADAKDVANVKVSELNNLITTQSSLYGQQAANWRQEQATANTRLNASSTALQTGIASADRLAAQGASGIGQMGNIWGTIAAGKAAGEMYGAYASGAPTGLPPAAAAVYELQLPGGGTMKITGGAQGAGAAPGAGAGMPPAAMSIDEAVRADVSAANPSGGGGLPRIPGGGFLPPGNSSGASFNAAGGLPGQVRQPGYSAPPDITTGTSGAQAMPMSALMSALPPDILDDFAPDVLGEALQDPEIMGMFGMG